jgi:hypothetical protein
MRLDQPINDITTVDVSALVELCSSPDLDWDSWDFRQKTYPQHKTTKTLPLLFLKNGNHPNQTELIEQYPQPPALEEAVQMCVQPLLDYFNGYAVKLMFSKLLVGGHISPHRDSGITLETIHRCHLPIITDPDVDFIIDGTVYNFPVGQWREFDNQRPHEVVNRSTIDRIHLMCDVYVPGS